jgi:hypothetical protein
MKSTIMLTIGIFLVSAPAPDSKTISEVSAGFLLSSSNSGLLAAQNEPALETETISMRKSETVTPQVTESSPPAR